MLEEKLVLAAQGSVPMIFRPTNVLFTATTNNTCRPSTFCNGITTIIMIVLFVIIGVITLKSSLEVLNYWKKQKQKKFT